MEVTNTIPGDDNSKLDLTAENKLIEDKVAERQANVDPFEAASMMFGLYTPHLERLVAQLSTGQLRRLINALVQYPLNDKIFITEESQTLKDAYNVGQSVLEAKWMMIQKTMMDNYEKQQAELQAANELLPDALPSDPNVIT